MDSTSRFSAEAIALFIPSATYRLQFHGKFTFADALKLVAYLDRLGIGACYASPIFQACPGSTHGYDVCDFNRFNAEIGSASEFDRLVEQLHEHGLGLVLDVVPNHMGICASNGWWWDVLELGPRSAYANHFDIDWNSPLPGLAGKVLLPVLGEHYGSLLRKGEISLALNDGALVFRYGNLRFPVSPQGYHQITGSLEGRDRSAEVAKLAAEFAQRFIALSKAEGSSARADFVSVKQQLCDQLEKNPLFAAAMHERISQLNTREDDGDATPPRIHALLETQHYRLACWKVGPLELNYRRFFDVTSLVGLRMETAEVFQDAHQLVLRLVQEGKVHGLRVDHPDGLLDPQGYFARLQQAALRGPTDKRATPTSRSIYLLGEKILAANEPLPHDWPIHGTTGYDFLVSLNGLFVDPASEPTLTKTYHRYAEASSYPEIVRRSKRKILETSLGAELEALVRRWKIVSSRTFAGRDYTTPELRDALSEVIACMQVYRTYLGAHHPKPSPDDQRRVAEAINLTKMSRPDLDPALVDFIGDLLSLRGFEGAPESEQRDWLQAVLKFQQITGPVMAKGAEDTAFYLYGRLISLNEVGGNPGTFGTSVEAFHHANKIRGEQWPHSMLATATHDTKRGEDMRARINVLSELAAEWVTLLDSLQHHLAHSDRGHPALDDNTKYFLYQTIIGAWPPGLRVEDDLRDFRDRISEAMLKSIREAKQHTSWVTPNADYERNLQSFIDRRFVPSQNKFLHALYQFQSRLAFFGYWNSLSQVLLKAASPGVPDFYQGAELWDFSLVDPDNRRAVDYATRRKMLDELDQECSVAISQSFLNSLVQNPATGRIKLFLTAHLLRFRREHQALFAHGQYVPAPLSGPNAKHGVAFLRIHQGEVALAFAPRLVAGLTGAREVAPVSGVWKGTYLILADGLPTGSWQNILTREQLSPERHEGQWALGLEKMLGSFPVALLSLRQ